MENTNVNVENQGANNTSSNNNNPSIDMEQLTQIINKGISQKENSILKSYFQQQGLSEDEMKLAIESYKSNKKTEETKNTKEFEDLTNNYANLQKQFNQERVNNALQMSLLDKGLSKEQIPFISKLVEIEGILDAESNINQEKLTENIENVFKAFPNLVPSKEENKSYVQIGASNNSQYEESETEYLRKIFGLK